MSALRVLRTRTLVLLCTFVFAGGTVLNAQVSRAAPVAATASWTVRLNGKIAWQQVTPSGALLVGTDNALASVDTERGQVAWQKPELGGLSADDVRSVEGSLLMQVSRPGLLLIIDPV